MFDLTKVEIQDDFKPLPTGNYPAYIEKAEWKTSKAGAEYLNVCWKVFGEDYANRVLFETFNLYHAKEQVRNIAMGSVKKMMMAAGLSEADMIFKTKEELVAAMLRCRCEVYVKVIADANYGDKNEVKGYNALKTKSEVPTISADQIPF